MSALRIRPSTDRVFECLDGVSERYRTFRNVDSTGLSDLLPFLKFLQASHETVTSVTVFSSEKADLGTVEKSLREEFPVSFVLGRGNGGTDVQIDSVRISRPNAGIRPIFRNGARIGTVLEHPLSRVLSLEGMRFEEGLPETQFDQAYSEILATFSENGFDFPRNAVKSWNYLRNVLSTYPAFNRARNRAFESLGLRSEYPAGTGIDCLLSGNAEMVSAAYAVAFPNGGGRVRSIKSDRQCEAETYGPKFARAKAVELPGGRKKVFVSGTASVGANGETLNATDIIANVRHTMSTVEDILTVEGLWWGDVLRSFAYVKKPEFLPVFEAFRSESSAPDFPYVHNVCHICRDDWLFEFECVAGR